MHGSAVLDLAARKGSRRQKLGWPDFKDRVDARPPDLERTLLPKSEGNPRQRR
jgi:hypothetical protein